jgi:hypothetical protein
LTITPRIRLVANVEIRVLRTFGWRRRVRLVLPMFVPEGVSVGSGNGNSRDNNATELLVSKTLLPACFPKYSNALVAGDGEVLTY